jgi:uncharacterized protein YutE (UPF0331/DUF86 family)
VVRRKLLHIEEAVARLRSWQPVDEATLENDTKLQWAVERGLQVAAEAVFDVGSHILAGAFREAVEEYREIAPRLAARNVIAHETANRLEGLAGFRNILVHDYARVRLDKLVEGLGRLDDLVAFAHDVERWLQAQDA